MTDTKRQSVTFLISPEFEILAKCPHCGQPCHALFHLRPKLVLFEAFCFTCDRELVGGIERMAYETLKNDGGKPVEQPERLIH